MAEQGYPFRIDPECFKARIRAKELNGRGDILECVSEGKGAGASPGAPIVEIEHIHSGSPKRLRQVEVALIAVEAMQQNFRGMEISALGQEVKAVETGRALL